MPTTLADAGELFAAPLTCPLCDYDLRGLPPGRCPECGHGFDPAELRRAQELASRRPLPWLIEYGQRGGARELPVRPWLATPLATMRPRYFWRTLRPEMPVRTRRLLFYQGMILAVAALGACVAVLPDRVDYMEWSLWRLPASGGVISWLLGTAARRFWSMVWPILLLAGLWPALSFLALVSLRASRQQARIRIAHVLRAMVYSADVFAWLGPLLIAVRWVEGLRLPVPPPQISAVWLEGMGASVLYLAVPLLAIFTYRLVVAHQLYLRFPHALITVLITQFILWLLLLIVLSNGLHVWLMPVGA